MSWPSDNKSDITRLDNANDTLGRSRREIKRGIDNVNTILDEFDINTVNIRQVLVYKNGKWTPTNTEAFGTPVAIIECNRTRVFENADIDNFFTVKFDPFNITSFDSANGNLSLVEGTYYFEQQGEYFSKSNASVTQNLATIQSIKIQVDGNNASDEHKLIRLNTGGNSGGKAQVAVGTTSHVAIVDSTSTGRIDAILNEPGTTQQQFLSWIIYKLA